MDEAADQPQEPAADWPWHYLGTDAEAPDQEAFHLSEIGIR